MPKTPPRWDMTNVYPALESAEFKADSERLKGLISDLESYMSAQSAANADTPPAELAAALGGALDRFNAMLLLSGTLQAYLHSFVSTDTFNTTALRLLSEFEQVAVRMEMLEVQFLAWVGRLTPVLPQVLDLPGTAREHAFSVREAAEQSRYQMSANEEALAAELNLSGANAWGKLQSTVTSQLSVDFELDGEVKALPLPALINLRGHPDAETRRRGYEAELKALASIREPLAAAMNGIKGTVNTLNRRRGRVDAVHSSIDQARIDRPTLETLLGAMHDSFPMFRRYFRAKAAKLGKEKLPWYDLFAPMGSTSTTYTFDEARDFILASFANFSPDLSAFAKRAFDHNWIDAEQRRGKVGGAFCMGVPGVQESRVMCNFDGSLDQVSTLAHELGHAFHNDCIYRAGRTPIQRRTPMTLAETASIMCETIVSQASLATVGSRDEELAILETSLNGASQVIVDIYSRYLFEKEVFERRANAELSADDLCAIMENAQKATYGDGLDERYLHPYMWTWKPHYYDAGLSFYNYPYAFGLLFGTGLYAIYQQRGSRFVTDYKNLLSSTGMGSAAELAARFDIDLRKPDFWQASLKVFEAQIERYVEL